MNRDSWFTVKTYRFNWKGVKRLSLDHSSVLARVSKEHFSRPESSFYVEIHRDTSTVREIFFANVNIFFSSSERAIHDSSRVATTARYYSTFVARRVNAVRSRRQPVFAEQESFGSIWRGNDPQVVLGRRNLFVRRYLLQFFVALNGRSIAPA